MDDLNHVATLIIKTALIVGIIIFLFNSFQFLDKKLDTLLPKLPRFILYILIVIFAIIWILIKLASFNIIQP